MQNQELTSTASCPEHCFVFGTSKSVNKLNIERIVRPTFDMTTVHSTACLFAGLEGINRNKTQ